MSMRKKKTTTTSGIMTIHPTLERIRNISPDSFKEMIKAHLTRLIDIETGFDFEAIESESHEHTNAETIFGAPLTYEGICCMSQLIKHIKDEDNIVSQGIFRQSGSCTRQNQLQAMLAKGETVTIDDRFNVYTCCDVLKKFVRDLPKPLLTDTMSPLFLATNDITSEEKRLNALRLLVLLLPVSNRSFFAELIDLFRCVVAHCETNLMNALNIAICFGPQLLIAREMMVRDQLDLFGKVQNTIVFMIDRATELFEPPLELLADAEVFLVKRDKKMKEAAQMCSTPNSIPASLVSTTSLIPAPKFCVQAATTYNSDDYTKQQLAELMASMMDSMNSKQANGSKSAHKSKKWLSKLNKENNLIAGKGKADTPLLQRDRTQQQLVKEAMKARASAKKSNFKQIFKKTFGTSEKSHKTQNSQQVPSSSEGQLTPATSIDSFLSHLSNETSSPRSIVPLAITPLVKGSLSRPRSAQRSATIKPDIEKRMGTPKVTPLKVENTNTEEIVKRTPSNSTRKSILIQQRAQSFKVTPTMDLQQENKNEEAKPTAKVTKRLGASTLKRNRTYVNIKPSLPPKPIKLSKSSHSAVEVRPPVVRSVTMKTFRSENLNPTWLISSRSINNLAKVAQEDFKSDKASSTSLIQDELQQIKNERKVTKITAKFEPKKATVVVSPTMSDEYVDLVKVALKERNYQSSRTTIETKSGQMAVKHSYKQPALLKLHKPKMPTPPPPRPVRRCEAVGRKLTVL